jgi:hypothetical protein
MRFEESLCLLGNIDRSNDCCEVGVATESAALAFRKRKFSETNAQRYYTPDVKLVETIAISKKLSAEVPPSLGEKKIEL